MSETQQLAESQIAEIVERHPRERESLIPLLQDIQQAMGFLSEDAIQELASLIDVSENEIFGVATFYAQFRFEPPAEHTICVCEGTACHVRGGHQILHDFEERLGIKPGETTPDGKFGLERVACVGCCALAPVVVVDGKVNAGMTPKRIKPIISKLAKDNGKS